MKRFASNRLYLVVENVLLRNYTIEIDDITGEVVSYYPFDDELSFTEWLGGVIVISPVEPYISQISCYNSGKLQLYIDEEKCIGSIFPNSIPEKLLPRAYHITFFSVSDMAFTTKSRVVELY